MKLKFASAVGIIIFSIGFTGNLTHASESLTNLSAADIIKQAAAKYADLKSYSDDGTTVDTLGTNIASSYTFSINLARTNLYRIVWRQSDKFFMPKGAVWSSGDGDFLWMGEDFKPRKISGREMALASATGISGGVAASIPGTFFKMDWGNAIGASMADSKLKADEKIGNIDCYVLTQDAHGRTTTLWIGKQDFLIHQIENDTSAAAMKKMLEAQAAKSPQIATMLKAGGPQLFQDNKSVETHEDIVTNPALTKTDFDFQAPTASKP